MKNKIVTIILGLLLVVSAVANVWQFNNCNNIKTKYNSIQSELDSLNEKYNSINSEISAKNEEIETLSSKITELESTLQTLQSDNESLLLQIEELTATKSDLEKQLEGSLLGLNKPSSDSGNNNNSGNGNSGGNNNNGGNTNTPTSGSEITQQLGDMLGGGWGTGTPGGPNGDVWDY